MTTNGWFQFFFYAIVLTALTAPLGLYMARVFQKEQTFLDPVLVPVENLCYRLFGVDGAQEMTWVEYAIALLAFSVAGMILLYLLQRLQGYLPFNPMHFGTGSAPKFATGMTQDLAFNTSASFTTNTNWQAYSGETTLSYLVQMCGLTVHNFVSAAAGIAVALAFIRGFARRESKTVGNFWFDMVRCTLWVLLPGAVIFALILLWQGCPQNLHAYTQATTLQGASQLIAQGPVASQEAIKILGTNGGGFFNANSAHPFENPTPLTNLLQMLAMLVIGAAICITFGKMIGNTKQGWAIWGAMIVLFAAGFTVIYLAESAGNPTMSALVAHHVPNMEGKEVRFGIANTALFATTTTDASCGAVNGMHDSFTPLGGMIPMLNIMLGELIFGGVGSGLYMMLFYVIITIFIAGLMVGRTPEFVGKKIEAFEVKMTILGVLISPAIMLLLAAVAVMSKAGLAGIANPGAHGFSEILYAFVSCAGNNGSAFAGINVNTPFYNTLLGMDTLVGRFCCIIPALAIAGSLAKKKFIPESSGTMPTTNTLFVGLLVGSILIVGALTFFPALALGPLVEHFQMLAGKVF